MEQEQGLLKRRCQLKLLDALLEVDRICKKNNIVYNISYGTVLGAVRHDGFIPWDDDIDLDMDAKNYKKFLKACKKDLNQDIYYIENKKTDPHCIISWTKIAIKNTTALNLGHNLLDMRHPMFIDIFKYNYKPKNPVIFKICVTLHQKIRTAAQAGFLNSPMLNRLERWHIAPMLVRLANYLIDFLCSFNVDRSMTITNWENHLLSYPTQLVLPTKPIMFEGHVFPAPSDPDKYLTYVYGDYMTPPPIDQRNQHEFVLDPDVNYTEYLCTKLPKNYFKKKKN